MCFSAVKTEETQVKSGDGVKEAKFQAVRDREGVLLLQTEESYVWHEKRTIATKQTPSLGPEISSWIEENFAHKDTHAKEESIQRKKSEKAFLYAEWLGWS